MFLGFVPIRRPGSFNFDGAWLFGYGIGIHLLQSEDPESMPKKLRLIPRIIIFLSSVRAWGLWRRNSRRWNSSTSEPWWRKVASTLINCSSTTRMAS
ncbi:metallothiol transferase FosB-like [Prunus yedoensis var. nudiflora]|uniref:Metallothiol transferase FosB-like n=1 Tax=Prunus yedoensis var. nudiflora TaxID=2094558 RepID=A0A314UXY8_PRUYE|nr:metallothiol transferase FosB-like [Prunus yedoensis var. nudiflora]